MGRVDAKNSALPRGLGSALLLGGLSGSRQPDVVDDEAGLEARVLDDAEAERHGLAREGGDVERLLRVAGGLVEVGVGGQGGAADLHRELVVLSARGRLSGVD